MLNGNAKDKENTPNVFGRRDILHMNIRLQ